MHTTKRLSKNCDREMREALVLWETAGRDLELARRKFNQAENSFETEAAIFEMGSAEVRRSRALCEIRNITMARDIKKALSTDAEGQFGDSKHKV